MRAHLSTASPIAASPSPSKDARRREAVCVALLVLIFVCFTWRGLTMFYSSDDLMNMYYAWTRPALKLWKAQFLPWMPLGRPLGNGVYRVFYGIFGFHPLPLYILCWLLLIGNVILSWRFFRTLASSVFIALVALSLTLVHGLFQDLYLSAGTIYDRLCFLFTVLTVTVYCGIRRDAEQISGSRVALVCFLCLMAMNSKESGAAVPAILFCYECIYIFPEAWQQGRVRRWLQAIAPLYCLLTCIVVVFVFGRVHRTDVLVGNPAYEPHASLGFWLTNVAGYLSTIVYHHIQLSGAMAAVAPFSMMALACALRNRTMLFGWFYFVIALTPVALISPRPGYVLYVPLPGIGLYIATLIGLAGQRALPLGNSTAGPFSRPQAAVVAAITGLIVWIHTTHWPEPWVVKDSPEWRLTEKMRRDYPTLKPGAKILFADEYPSNNGYDPMFNLQLLYRDPLIEVARVKGNGVLRPERPPADFDIVFTTSLGTYVELDRRNPEESIRLNILQDYQPARLFDVERIDHAGYLVSGFLDSGKRGIGSWTTRASKLKFDLHPADTRLTLKFWLPDYVAAGEKRTLSLVVGGETMGTASLSQQGENNISFPVPARAINPSGFTILELNVDRPYKKDGQEYGVVLLQAGFDYVSKR